MGEDESKLVIAEIYLLTLSTGFCLSFSAVELKNLGRLGRDATPDEVAAFARAVGNCGAFAESAREGNAAGLILAVEGSDEVSRCNGRGLNG